MARRSHKTILAEINDARNFDKVLAVEAVEFCQEKKLCPLDTFFDHPSLCRNAIQVWSGDEFLTWLVDRTTPAIRSTAGRAWDFKNKDRTGIRNDAVSIMNEHFIHSRCHEIYRLYEILNRNNKVVRPVSISDGEIDIMRALAPTLESEGVIATTGLTKLILDYYRGHGKLTEKPILCAQPDDDRYCLHKMTMRPDRNVEFPLLKAFFGRMNDGEACAAWLSGIVTDRYRGRQVLYLQGERGEDGKSSFMKAFASLFGTTAGSLDWTTMKNNASFVGSLLVDKRFAYVPDNKNPKLLMGEIFKSLANPGADPVIINHKYGKMYVAELEAHLAVVSNYAPAISGEGHNTSRTLWIQISPLADDVERDPNYGQKIMAELPGWLAWAEDCYNERCRNDYVIEVNEAVQQAVEDAVEQFNSDNDMILDDLFVIEPDAYGPTAAGMKKILKEWGLKPDESRNFVEWLVERYDVRVRQGSDGTRRHRGIREKTSKDFRKVPSSDGRPGGGDKPKGGLHLITGGGT